jgi:hypothetical protein
MEMGYRPGGCAFRAKAKQIMQFFAPVVCKDEQGGILSREMINTLAIDVVCGTSAVAGLRVTESLYRGVHNGGEEDGLNADEYMAKL